MAITHSEFAKERIQATYLPIWGTTMQLGKAAGACSDMIRDTIARLADSPEWTLEVVNKSV